MDSIVTTLPSSIYHELLSYIRNGEIPNPFLEAILTNDLASTFREAGDRELPYIKDILQFLYYCVLSSVYGTSLKVKDHILLMSRKNSSYYTTYHSLEVLYLHKTELTLLSLTLSPRL